MFAAINASGQSIAACTARSMSMPIRDSILSRLDALLMATGCVSPVRFRITAYIDHSAPSKRRLVNQSTPRRSRKDVALRTRAGESMVIVMAGAFLLGGDPVQYEELRRLRRPPHA